MQSLHGTKTPYEKGIESKMPLKLSKGQVQRNTEEEEKGNGGLGDEGQTER